jgi:hypothetical protein
VVGEAGGHLAPGAGLLTFGTILLLPATSGASTGGLRFTLCLACALALGIGAGLTGIAGALVLLGGRYHEFVEFMGAGLGFLAAGLLTFSACAEARELPKGWPLVPVLLGLTGVVICCLGILG